MQFQPTDPPAAGHTEGLAQLKNPQQWAAVLRILVAGGRRRLTARSRQAEDLTIDIVMVEYSPTGELEEEAAPGFLLP